MLRLHNRMTRNIQYRQCFFAGSVTSSCVVLFVGVPPSHLPRTWTGTRVRLPPVAQAQNADDDHYHYDCRYELVQPGPERNTVRASGGQFEELDAEILTQHF